MQIIHKIVLSFLICMLILTPVLSQSPGSSTDPLVTKSYIDHFIRFRTVALKADTTVVPETGALFVLRSGKMTLKAEEGKTLINLTKGKPISDGEVIPANHLVLVPESSGIYLKVETLSLLMASALQKQEG